MISSQMYHFYHSAHGYISAFAFVYFLEDSVLYTQADSGADPRYANWSYLSKTTNDDEVEHGTGPRLK